MLHFLTMLPFTILMGALIAAAGIWTKTHRKSLSPKLFHSVGFAPLHLLEGRWSRLLTSVFFTAGGAGFYFSLVMLLLSVGMAEIRCGTWQTVLIFWGIHLGSLLLGSFLVVLLLHLLQVYQGILLATAHDVGPSAGYYGCLGAACNSHSHNWPPLVIGCVILFLAARLVWSLARPAEHGRDLSADVSHLIAFLLGLFAAEWLAAQGGFAATEALCPVGEFRLG